MSIRIDGQHDDTHNLQNGSFVFQMSRVVVALKHVGKRAVQWMPRQVNSGLLMRLCSRTSCARSRVEARN